jgi:hypothetical protein
MPPAASATQVTVTTGCWPAPSTDWPEPVTAPSVTLKTAVYPISLETACRVTRQTTQTKSGER